MSVFQRLASLFRSSSTTERDRYVSLLLSHVGERYSARGECRCHGTCPGWDCSGFASGDLLKQAGGPYLCGNTDTLAATLKAQHLTCSRATARATKGAWAIRTKENPIRPHDGHIVISLGDGRTVEAHDTADGVYIGTFDGNRGFQVYGYPPGISGFAESPSPNPGPTTIEESNAMGMPAQIVPGSHTQTKAPWKGRWPFIGFLPATDGSWDAVGFNGARILNDGAVKYLGMSVLHLGVLHAGISTAVAVDNGRVVGLAGDGGSFTISTAVDYL